MAGDVQLKLQVGLDLAFLRNQLSTIGTQLGGQPLQINVKFDRQKIANEYRLLNRYLGNKTFRASIETNLQAEIRYAEKLRDTIKEISTIRATGAAMGVAARKAPGIDILANQSRAQLLNIRKLFKEAGVPVGEIKNLSKATSDQLKASLLAGFESAGEDAVKGLFAGLKDESSKSAQIAAKIGGDFLNAYKKWWRIASPSKKAKDELGKPIGEGIGDGIDNGLKDAQSLSVGGLRRLFNALKGEARKGATEISALMAASMAGIVQLPGSRRQRARLQQAGENINAGMQRPSLPLLQQRIAEARTQINGIALPSLPPGGNRPRGGMRGVRNAGLMPGSLFAARSESNYQDIISSMAGLTKNPRAAGLMLRQLPEQRIRTSLLDKATQQAQYYENVPLAREIQRSTKGFDPLLKAIAQEFTDYTKSLNPSNPWVGKIGDGLRKVTEVASVAAGQKALPPAWKSASPFNSLIAQLASSRSAFGNAQTSALFAARSNVLPGVQMGSAGAGISRGRGMPLFPIAQGPARPSTVTYPMMARGRFDRTGKGAGFGSFVPDTMVSFASSAKSAQGPLVSLLQGLAALKQNAQSAASAIQSSLNPSFGQTRQYWRGITRNVATQNAAQGGGFFSTNFVNARGGMSYYSGGRFPMAGMMGPSSPLGQINAQTSMFGANGSGGGGRGGGAGGGGGGFAGFNGPNFGGIGRAMTSFNRASSGISLPGGNAVRELGNEFKYATQQVLLFGTAYKGLAFLMGFPQQVGDAVASLQNFRNSLGAISPTAQEAAESNAAILDLVDRYNIPLQSARDGFVKLYASMQPAGFDGDEIRGLFEGISKAAATYGMSADKVDRVTYAFAQMASKGQVMSEELKGQLGDVLPGAMALFAKAAGFDGPDAISKFSKALEDGAYKGQAMTALLKNVTLVMNREFGPGAEGAALTFQGVVNRLQNSMTLLYESFEPVAVGFLNQVVVPLTRGIKEVADGVNAFLTDASTTTTNGFAIAQELEKLRPSLEGIRQNVAALIQQFRQFAQVALEIGKIFLQIAGNPIVGYLARLYAIVLPLNIALNVMRGLWASNALQFIIFNARVATGTSTLGAFRAMMAATGATAQATGLTIRTFFATTGVGLVVAGIGILIERFMTLEQRLANVREKAVGAAQAIRAMTSTEARAEEQRATKALKLVRRLQGQQALYPVQNKADERVGLSEADAQLLEGMGIPVAKGLGGGRSLARMNLEGIAQKIDTLYLSEARSRQQQLKFEEKQTEAQLKISPVSPTGVEEKKKGKEKQRYVSELAKQLQKEMEIRLNMIKQDASLSDRQREVRAAALRYDYELLINKAEYNSGVNDENKKDILNRQGYLADLKRTLDQENELSRQRYEDVVTKPLRDALDQDRKSVVSLTAATGALAEGRSELTKVEERQIMIKQELDGLDDEQIKKLKPLIDLVLEQAAAVDKLTASQKALKAEKGVARAIEDLQIEAGLITPRQAAALKQRREFADQITSAREAGASPEQITRLLQAQAAVPIAGSIDEKIKTIKDELNALVDVQNMVVAASEKIGESFAQSFKDTISGAQTAQQALASFFQRIGDYFLDMAARMIQKWIEMQIIGLVGSLIPSGGSLLTSGLSGGFSTSSAFSMAPGSVPAAGGITMPSFTGGIGGGIQGFANGGMVTGPTLGLVGEGRYNEAIVPLPDGKSIPVDLGGAAGNQIVSNITVNVSNGQAQSNATGANSSELGRKLEGAVKQVIIGELRPGGLLSR